VNFAICLTLVVALGVIQWMIGGARLAYGLPAYALVALAAVLSLRALRRPSASPSAVCIVSTLLFGGYVLLRGWASPNAFLARPDLFLAAACLVVYLLSALVVVSTRVRMGIVCALFGIAVVQVIVGMMQFTGYGDFMLFGVHRSPGYGVRASGMLLSPNHLAGLLNAVALFALSFTFWSRSKLPAKLVLGYLLLACFLGIAATGSRGGYLSLIAGLLVFIWVSLRAIRLCKPVRYSQAFLGASAALILLIGGALYAMQESPMLFKRLWQIDTASLDVRRCNWLSSLDQFRFAPAFGTGAGTHLSYGRLFRNPQLQSDSPHAYNDYLELLAEYGLVGGVLGAFFLFAHLRSGLQAVRVEATWRLMETFEPTRSNPLALTLGAMGAVGALLVHSVVDSNMHLPGNALLYAFLFGILGSPGVKPSDEDVPASFAERSLRGVLGFAGCVLLLVTVFQYPGEFASERARHAWDANKQKATLQLAAAAIQKTPSNPSNYFYQGEAFRAIADALPQDASRENDLSAAIVAYRKGLERFPGDVNAWIRLGQCLDGVRRVAEAEDAYNSAIALDPNLGILYAYYATHLQLAGDDEGAQRCWETARTLGPEPTNKKSLGELPSLLDADTLHGLPVPKS
jgi:O-antigen ligase